MNLSPENDQERLACLKNLLVDHVTGSPRDEREYQQLRKELASNHELCKRLPPWFRTHRTLSDLWNLMKPQFPHYRQRREFLREEFEPAFAFLDEKPSIPFAGLVDEGLRLLEVEHVLKSWDKALTRRLEDPEGAITAARTLLENVCKCILDERRINHENDDLPGLYGKVASALRLAPSQHTEKLFKQILGSCQAVVEGIGSIRNKLGDAHGSGKSPVKPASRHAELVVNLAGSMAAFLVATYQETKSVP
jgi:hypothetical protein